MKSLRVCFVGYGSIAKRHIANLHSLCKEKKIDLSIDVLRHSKGNDKKNNERLKYVDLIKYDKLGKQDIYDIIFITNPTSEHYKTLKKYKDNAKIFFMEKPACSYNDLSKMARLSIDPNRVYVACPIRYKKVIQYIKTKIDLKNVISARVICSSYLPDWRKGTDYTKSYSANKKLGGGVRLDLIHEMDYIKYLFGYPKDVICKFVKYSNLKIDTEDLAVYILEYKDKLVELHLDYFGRAPQRIMELYTENDVIVIDLLKNEVKSLIKNKHNKFKENRDDFQLCELRHMLDMYFNKAINDNNLTNSIKTILLAKG